MEAWQAALEQAEAELAEEAKPSDANAAATVSGVGTKPEPAQDANAAAQQQRDKEMRKTRDETITTEVCRNFLNNRCTRGSMCKFLHPNASAGTLAQKRSRSPIVSDRTDICRDFARNLCTRGKQCRFYHPPVNQVEKHWFNICLDFQNGKCRRRDCRLVAQL